MLIADVLAAKGTDVVTVAPDTGVRQLVQVLNDRKIGAAVVTSGMGVIAGVVSERDVVRRLHVLGNDLLTRTVEDIMTTSVLTCAGSDTVDAVLGQMTDHRVRHMPVVANGALVGLVSIGDLVKSRIGELTEERDQLTAYISG